MAGLIVDITAKMNNFRAILPRATAKDVAESFMFATVKGKATEHGLLSKEVRVGVKKWLIIEGQWYIIQDVGPCNPVRILVDQNGDYKFQVHYATLESGHYDDKNLDVILQQMKSSEYTICPGFKDKYVEIKDILTDNYKPIKVREWPGKIRYDSIDCKLWYDRTGPDLRTGTRYMCWPCNSLLGSIRQSKKRAQRRIGEAEPPKCMPLKFMKPEIRRKVLRKKRKETYDLIKKLKKYENTESGSQDKEPAGTLTTKDTSVPSKNKSVTTKDTPVTTKDTSVTTKDTSVPSKNKSVTTKDTTVTTTDTSVTTKDTSLTSKDTVATKKNKDDHAVPVEHNSDSASNEAVNIAQKKKVTAKKKKTKVATAVEKNNDDNATASVERNSDLAESIQKRNVAGKKIPEWVGVAVQNNKVATPIEKNRNEIIACARKKKKTNARKSKKKSVASADKPQDTVTVAISGETIKDRSHNATLVGKNKDKVVADKTNQIVDSMEKNKDIMMAYSEKRKDNGTILAEKITDRPMELADVNSGNVSADVGENKEEIAKATGERNEDEMITSFEKNQKNSVTALMNNKDTVNTSVEENELKTENADINVDQIATAENADKNIDQIGAIENANKRVDQSAAICENNSVVAPSEKNRDSLPPANKLIDTAIVTPVEGIGSTSVVKMEDSGVVVAEKNQDVNAAAACKNINKLSETFEKTKDTAPASAKKIRDRFAVFAKKVKEKGTQRAVRRSVYPATSPVARGVTWQWESDVAGKWNDFDIDVATLLEEGMNKSVTVVDLTTSKFNLPYHIDLKNMTQTRVNTGRTRKIRQAFTPMSYPSDTNAGQSSSSSQNGLKRKTVINKNASLKKSKTVPSSSSAASGFVPPPQTFPVNGLAIFPNFPAAQGSNSQQPSLQGGQSQIPVTVFQQQQGPLTRNKYNQAMSGFSSQPPAGTQTSTSSTLPGTGSSIFGMGSSSNISNQSQSMFGSWHTPTTFPYMPSSSATSQTSGFSPTSGFGLQPPSFHSFLNPSSSHTGSQQGFSFGSQPMPMSFNPSSFLSRSGRSRVRPSNPGASSIPSAGPGQAAPSFQQSPFQTASATVPSATPFPNHARIPNNVPKGGKGGKHVLCADDILHNYVKVVAAPPANEDCCICYEKLIEASGQGTGGSHDRTVIQLEKCSHMFHKLCLDALFNSGPKDGSLQCPSCKTIYGEKMGNCPRGEMEYLIMNHRLAGYEDCNTIQILYHIHSGTQGPEHPHPGQRYTTRGFPRIGYLPNNDKGRKVLQLLIVAWKRRLTFTIGTSTTTGEGDTVTWNEIHHKTEHTSNYSGHGYPDPKYLDNVLLELAVHGITEKDLPP